MELDTQSETAHSDVDRAEMTDGDVVRRVQTGDREAFGVLVTRHMRRAYYSALGLVGSHDDALDVSQEAFVRAFRARSTIDPDRPFFPWLYQILRRLCFNVTRDRQTEARVLQNATPWLRMEAVEQAHCRGPEQSIEQDELRARIERGVIRLTPNEREVLTLKEFQGLRYREIAELLDIPIGTVMSRLYGARRSLANWLRGTQ